MKSMKILAREFVHSESTVNMPGSGNATKGNKGSKSVGGTKAMAKNTKPGDDHDRSVGHDDGRSPSHSSGENETPMR